MLKQRPLIGVIMAEGEGFYQNRFLKGIITECYAKNMDVAIFTTFIKDCFWKEYKVGEKNIYNLINFDLLDGVLVAPLSLNIENLKEDIEKLLLMKCKCPVLYLDYESVYYPSIFTDDSTSIEHLVDHLIEVHGYRDINCLAGPPDSPSTLSRVAGYKKSLIKHGITVGEDKISYDGDFWYSGGKLYADKIISGEIPRPEAVVCISDHMAVGLIEELMENGIRVPEDIAITGYDATDVATACISPITTYEPPLFQMGIESVCVLIHLIEGVKPEPSTYVKGNLVMGHSCGCEEKDFYHRVGFLGLKEKEEENKAFTESYMMESLTMATSFNEYIRKFHYYLYLIKNYSDYYLCLCENWDGSVDNYSHESSRKNKVGYTENVNMVVSSENREYVYSNISFKTKDMIPNLWISREKPKAYFFTPIHFYEHSLGYSVLTFGENIGSLDSTYRRWSRNIMNALEFSRIQQRVYRSSFRDVLTGIYSRNGLNLIMPSIVKETIDQKKKLMCIMGDLDGLKGINDGYGHEEGDNVLTIVANALQSSCTSNEFCARIGGDEFLVVGYEDSTEEYVNGFIANVMNYIDNYNNTSKKCYKIRASFGAYCDYIKNADDVKEITDKADKIMYINKAKNKK